MAQAMIDLVKKTEAAVKEEEKDEKQDNSSGLECAVCLQTCIHPARLPCSHIFCYLCVKGVANQRKNCPMCRQEIPADFVEKPQLVEIEEIKVPGADEEYHWFYEGRNGWWQYDQRTSLELETAYKQGKRTCELFIAGFLYIADFGSMLQLRRNDPSRHRRIKRDLHNVPKKGVAGLRLNAQDDDPTIVREIRGAERPASPVNDTMGTGDGTNTPVPPSNTPQTPAGQASGDATPLVDQTDHQRQDSLHQVLEQMRSLMLRGRFSINNNNDVEEDRNDERSFSDNHTSMRWLESSNPDTTFFPDEDNS